MHLFIICLSSTKCKLTKIRHESLKKGALNTIINYNKLMVHISLIHLIFDVRRLLATLNTPTYACFSMTPSSK